MKNPVYSAKFSNGRTLSRSSKRTFTHAFITTVDGGERIIAEGFSSSEDGAMKEARLLIGEKKSYGGVGAMAYKNRGPQIEVVAVSVST